MQIALITQFNNNKRQNYISTHNYVVSQIAYIYGWQKFHYKRCIKALSKNTKLHKYTPSLSLSHNSQNSKATFSLVSPTHVTRKLTWAWQFKSHGSCQQISSLAYKPLTTLSCFITNYWRKKIF